MTRTELDDRFRTDRPAVGRGADEQTEQELGGESSVAIDDLEERSGPVGEAWEGESTAAQGREPAEGRRDIG